MAELNKLISESIEGLIAHVSKNIGESEDKVRKAFNSYKPGTKATSVSKTAAPKVENKVVPKAQPKTATPKTDSEPTTAQCSYTYQKGPKNGTRCTTMGKNKVNDKFYCATHGKSVAASSSQTPKAKSTAAPKTKIGAKIVADEKSKDLVNRIGKEKRQIKLNKYQNYVDHISNIVFDKKTGKAIGNQLEDGPVGPLSKSQMEECETNNWKFDPPTEKQTSKTKTLPTPPPKKELVVEEELELVVEEELELVEEELEEELELTEEPEEEELVELELVEEEELVELDELEFDEE